MYAFENSIRKEFFVLSINDNWNWMNELETNESSKFLSITYLYIRIKIVYSIDIQFLT